jgi:hypothetical protein
MLNLSDGPYLGLHGNRSNVYNFNGASYLSFVNNRPASSIINRCCLNPDKLKSFLLERGFHCIASHSHSVMDDTINKTDFLNSFSNGEKEKHLIDKTISETYSRQDEEIFVQISMKQSYLKGDPEKLICDVDYIDISFIEQHRFLCESLNDDIMKNCYQRISQFIDDETPIIGIIGSAPEGMYVKEYNIGKSTKTLSNEELDLHYGQEFSEFHERLTTLLKSDSKGLIIFHGEPGTGKTHYIRMLLKDLVKSKKNVLYVPSNFIDSFLDPNFITFISDWIIDHNNPTIILLEDAESLVESRESGVRSLGISNLLNITDGILNDILGTQIILTFNTNLDYIDSALLRPERLIARKEFSSLSQEESNLLIQQLGIDYDATKNMTLAEIYSLKNKRSVLYHNIKQKKSNIGFVI